MAITSLAPTFITPSQLTDTLKDQGYGVLSPDGFSKFVDAQLAEFDGIKIDWDALPPDEFLKDGGRYRRRRHSCFIVTHEQLTQVEHRAHYQPLDYNALHGGMHRLFAPMLAGITANPVWKKLLLSIACVCSAIKGEQPWYVEAHQFRIDTSNGIGRPTPEGAHRDGVDFVAILLVDRVHVSGGESRIFEAEGPHGQRFTLNEPWTFLLLDDQRVIHESTPIQPTADDGHRDTLVLTFRSGAFLDCI
jgi:hypothetical protein